tara:strand:+ start:297 stop:1130 length:834 start_codon:yes stop_codon:yes gene_type:complete
MIIWIASYPKSGNTWVRYFLKSYFNPIDKNLSLETKKDDNFSSTTFPNPILLKEMNIDYFNFGNIIKNWVSMQDAINLNNKINFLKTHNAMCTINNYPFTNAKNTLGGIYIVRDPRAIVASLADHFQISHEEAVENMMSPQHGEFPQENGKNYYLSMMGTWSDHYKSWKTYNGRKILIVKYEDLISKAYSTFSNIIKYLKDINEITFDEEKIKFSIEETSFVKLRKLEEKDGFIERGKGNFFFRKGKAGSWKEELNKDLINKIEKKFKKEMLELGYI